MSAPDYRRRGRTVTGVVALFAVATLAPPPPACRAATAPADRPHVVLFMADDHTWHDCGPYGAADVRTPNLDRLAREGMRFDLAFAPSPTCTPSRSAIYTALYPFRNGAHANHCLVNDGLRTLPHYMSDLGYRVVLAGKTHIGPREAFPFEYLEGSNVIPPGKKHVLWTDLGTASVEKLLASHDRQKQPLCLVVCPHSPHVYWPENDVYDPAKVKLPPYLLDTPETREARCGYYTDVTWMDRQLGEVLASLEKHGYLDRTLFVYTADQGAQWPFAKWDLYDAGIRSPMIVRWPGKVRPGSKTSAMVSLVDLLPTVVEAAGGAPPKEGFAAGEIDGRSFLPVLLGKQDGHRDRVFATHTGDGQMNRSPSRSEPTTRHKYVLNLAPASRFQTHISDGAPEDGRTYWDSWLRKAKDDPHAAEVVRRFHHRPAEELYDLEADPYEQKNLAADPAMAETRAALRESLKQWRVKQGEDLTRVPMPEDARRGEIFYAK